MGRQVIFNEVRDPRFITVRRGGSLQDADHRLLAVWAADCAQHVLHFFDQARKAAFAANAAAREVSGAAKLAALAAGQAVAVAHVAAHELGAAAYAIRAVCAAAPEDEREEAGRLECQWQRAQLPSEIRELVLDDQRLRNEKCWSVFHC
jgi:hypothetical protein